MTKVKVVFLSLVAAVLVGCGPNDATINSSVKQKLASDDTVKSATIEASTQNKVVTLTGTVDSQQTVDRAMMMARQADGVSNVVNQMTVMHPGFGPGGHGPGMMNNGMSGGGMGQNGAHGSGGMSGGHESSQPSPQKKPE